MRNAGEQAEQVGVQPVRDHDAAAREDTDPAKRPILDELVECQSRVGLLARPIPAVKIRRITG